MADVRQWIGIEPDMHNGTCRMVLSEAQADAYRAASLTHKGYCNFAPLWSYLKQQSPNVHDTEEYMGGHIGCVTDGRVPWCTHLPTSSTDEDNEPPIQAQVLDSTAIGVKWDRIMAVQFTPINAAMAGQRAILTFDDFLITLVAANITPLGYEVNIRISDNQGADILVALNIQEGWNWTFPKRTKLNTVAATSRASMCFNGIFLGNDGGESYD